MLDHQLRRIRHNLAHHQPPPPPSLEASAQAAVALLLQSRAEDLHLLFIHRAHHPHDPWSGHMAFPGGRKNPEDTDLCITIQREVKEEVGIDLASQGEYLGRLAELQAMSRGQLVDMTVTPFIYLISPEAKLQPDPAEVQDTIWVPLEFILQDVAESLVHQSLTDGITIDVPALLYGGKTIWGMTYRMLREFLELIAEK
jgi:8-oxo-dGTP pyrophosphatase MutT (NUDIX family)